MKRRFVTAMLVLVMGITFNCFAQEKTANSGTTPSTITSEKKEIKTIFNYKTELGLTDPQIQSIKDSISKLQASLSERAKQINTLSQELITMIKNKESIKLIKEKLEKIAAFQVENSISDIETSRGIEDVLTPAQLKKWKNIQTEAQDKLKAQAKEAAQKK